MGIIIRATIILVIVAFPRYQPYKKQFTCINSLIPHNNLMKQALLSFLVYR